MANEIIDTVLQASNHYDVLGIDAEEAADGLALRRAYLKRSVKTHPDKNPGNDRATQAFQKVTQAYNVLSDDELRQQYERYGEDDPTRSGGGTYYAQEGEPSFRDAMFVFASVASMMGGNSATADFANAMYFAESFLNNDKGIDLSDGKAKAQASMAAGASLRVVSNAMRGLGFTKTASVTDSAATLVQVAGLGAMVADTPVVKKALEDPKVKRSLEVGGQKLSQLGGSISAAVGAATKSSAQSRSINNEKPGEGASMSDSVKKAFGGFSAAAKDAVKKRQQQSSESPTNSHDQPNNPPTNSNWQSSFAKKSADLGGAFSSSRNGNANASSTTAPQRTSNRPPDSVDDALHKARTAGAAAESIRKAGKAAERMGMHQKAADLKEAAKMAEFAGRAAKAADNPLVKSALEQPAVRRAVESSAQQILKEAMKSAR